jgi:hypothetical protein
MRLFADRLPAGALGSRPEDAIRSKTASGRDATYGLGVLWHRSLLPLGGPARDRHEDVLGQECLDPPNLLQSHSGAEVFWWIRQGCPEYRSIDALSPVAPGFIDAFVQGELLDALHCRRPVLRPDFAHPVTVREPAVPGGLKGSGWFLHGPATR